MTCQKALLCVVACASLAVSVRADEVKDYVKDVPIEVKKGETIEQKRWYLENDAVRLGVVEDPGGAVVEFVNKATGTNHVAGEVWSRTVEGKVEKRVGYGWKDTVIDDATDPQNKQMFYQPYKVEIIAGENGAKTMKVTPKRTGTSIRILRRKYLLIVRSRDGGARSRPESGRGTMVP